jgi:hypothetical protein
MTITALKGTIQGQTPADIITADGGTIFVKHEDYMFIPPTGGIAIVTSEAGGVSILDVDSIARIEYKNSTKP